MKTVYQYSTFTPMIFSKKYFKTKKECYDHLKECIRLTNEHRSLWKKNGKFESPLTLEEIECGQKILVINLEKNPDVMNILGEQSDFSVEHKKFPEK